MSLPSPAVLGGFDCTSELWNEFNTISAIDIDWKSLRSYHFIFVPGFLANVVSDFQQTGRGTFETQMKLLRHEGVPVSYLATETQLPPEANSAALLTAVAASDRPIIFVTHSRGGLDVLEALLQSGDETISKIKGWIALQAPFHGTPLADIFIQYPALRWIADESVIRLGGNLDSIKSMSTKYRENYLDEALANISSLINQIPMISVVSWKPNGPGIDSIFEISRNLMEYLGFENDGVVPWKSGILPGSEFIILRGIDHRALVHRMTILDQSRITMSLIQMLALRMSRHGL